MEGVATSCCGIEEVGERAKCWLRRERGSQAPKPQWVDRKERGEVITKVRTACYNPMFSIIAELYMYRQTRTRISERGRVASDATSADWARLANPANLRPTVLLSHRSGMAPTIYLVGSV